MCLLIFMLIHQLSKLGLALTEPELEVGVWACNSGFYVLEWIYPEGFEGHCLWRRLRQGDEGLINVNRTKIQPLSREMGLRWNPLLLKDGLAFLRPDLYIFSLTLPLISFSSQENLPFEFFLSWSANQIRTKSYLNHSLFYNQNERELITKPIIIRENIFFICRKKIRKFGLLPGWLKQHCGTWTQHQQSDDIKGWEFPLHPVKKDVFTWSCPR